MQAADRATIERLFREHYPMVYAFCARMTRDPAEAEDLAQQAFLQAFRHLPTFRAGSPMKPWLFRIAHNICVDHLRRRRHHLPLETPDALATPSHDRGPEAAALAGEERARLETALASLNVDLRSVIVLRYQNDLSYEQIAHVIKKPVSTVTSRLFEARRQLASFLGGPASNSEGGQDALQVVGS
jgi:RNA polymerase sigma-70 factor (ECF subfamily)